MPANHYFQARSFRQSCTRFPVAFSRVVRRQIAREDDRDRPCPFATSNKQAPRELKSALRATTQSVDVRFRPESAFNSLNPEALLFRMSRPACPVGSLL